MRMATWPCSRRGRRTHGRFLAAILSFAASRQRAAEEHRPVDFHHGQPDFAQREAAMGQLMQLPVIPLEMLEPAMYGQDAEVRWRAEAVWRHSQQHWGDALFAAYRVIEAHKIEGLAEAISQSLPLCTQSYLADAARRAFRDGHRERRVLPTLDAGRPWSRPSAGRRGGLAESVRRVRGQRTAAAAFRPRRQGGPGGGEVAVERWRACRPGRTGPSAGQRQRERSNRGRPLPAAGLRAELQLHGLRPARGAGGHRDKLRRWAAGDGQTVAWKLQLGDEFAKRPGAHLQLQSAQVYEVDRQGRVVWEASGGQHPWGVEGLPNGHRLVASYSDWAVIEYDATGEEDLATCPAGPPVSAGWKTATP